jgi:hypothetical protein
LYVDFVPCFLFTTLDPNVDELGKEEIFENFAEVQGQIATQGKPPLLVAYPDPNFIYASFPFMFIFKGALFYNCYYLLIAIHLRLGSTSHLLSSLR